MSQETTVGPLQGASGDDDGGDVDVKETDASGDDDDEDDKTIDDDKEDEEEDEELNLKFSKVSLDLENEEISNSDVAAEEKEEVEKEDADDSLIMVRWCKRQSKSWGWNKKNGSSQKKAKSQRRDTFMDDLDSALSTTEVERMLGLGTSGASASQSVIEIEDEEFGHDDLDDETCFGTLRGNIVGLQYYAGTVNRNEMVALQREPHNPYDCNAIRVLNVLGIQVGHIKREQAKPLAHILDKGLARLEGVVPLGSKNTFSMPVDLTLWGKPEHQGEAVTKLKSCGYFLTGGAPISSAGGAGLSQGPSNGGLAIMQTMLPRRTYLSPAEMKNELDRVFENIEKGDKTSLAEPAEAIVTQLYPHQKQALNWMIVRENKATLPPFWEERQGQYHNTVLNFTTKTRPPSVCGGELQSECKLCGKIYSSVHVLRRHNENVHAETKPRPFQCELCDYAATNKWHLKEHYRRHTGEQPFECPICQKTFSHQGTMNRHCKIIHKFEVSSQSGDIGILSLTVRKLTTVPATRTALVTIRMINHLINQLCASTDVRRLNEQELNIMNADNILIFETQDVAEEVTKETFTMEEVVLRIQESKTPAVIIATVGEQRKMRDYFTNAATNHEREYCVLFVGENSGTDEIAYPNNMLMGVSTVELKMTSADNLLERYAFKILKNVSERLSQLTTTPTIDPYDVRDILVKIQCAVKRSGIPDSERPELIPAEEVPKTMIKAKTALLAAKGVGGCTIYNGRLEIYMEGTISNNPDTIKREKCVKQILDDLGVTVYKILHGDVTAHYAPGDCVLSKDSAPAIKGTLGGFALKMQQTSNSHPGLINGTPILVALAARHVFDQSQKTVRMYVDVDDQLNPPRAIGKTTMHSIGELDILPFEVFPGFRRDCKTRYYSREGKLDHANLVEDDAWKDLNGAEVHFRGATTFLGEGYIYRYEYERGNPIVKCFLIQANDDAFGSPGDSGSIVCTMRNNKLFALGMYRMANKLSNGRNVYLALRLKEAFHLLGTHYGAEFKLC